MQLQHWLTIPVEGEEDDESTQSSSSVKESECVPSPPPSRSSNSTPRSRPNSRKSTLTPLPTVEANPVEVQRQRKGLETSAAMKVIQERICCEGGVLALTNSWTSVIFCCACQLMHHSSVRDTCRCCIVVSFISGALKIVLIQTLFGGDDHSPWEKKQSASKQSAVEDEVSVQRFSQELDLEPSDWSVMRNVGIIAVEYQ